MLIIWAATTAAAGEHYGWICVLGDCAVDALVLSSARDSDRAQKVVKNKIQIVF